MAVYQVKRIVLNIVGYPPDGENYMELHPDPETHQVVNEDSVEYFLPNGTKITVPWTSIAFTESEPWR